MVTPAYISLQTWALELRAFFHHSSASRTPFYAYVMGGGGSGVVVAMLYDAAYNAVKKFDDVQNIIEYLWKAVSWLESQRGATREQLSESSVPAAVPGSWRLAPTLREWHSSFYRNSPRSCPSSSDLERDTGNKMFSKTRQPTVAFIFLLLRS